MGLYDMHGNVMEWCLDRFGPYPTRSDYDPRGPRSGPHRVLRGGSWKHSVAGCRSGARYEARPGARSARVGFRVVLAHHHWHHLIVECKQEASVGFTGTKLGKDRVIFILPADLPLPAGRHSLSVMATGYETKTVKLDVKDFQALRHMKFELRRTHKVR